MTQATQPAQAPATQNKELVDGVLARISEFQTKGDLRMPQGYSAENAVRSAWLLLQDQVGKVNGQDVPVLSYCTAPSVANALLKMVIQGLNPQKRQCSFIPYGNKLTLQREYAGSIAIAKRHGMKSVTANVVYDGDEFEFILDTDTGMRKVTKHVQTMATMATGKIIGAYAIVEMEDGRRSCEVMTMGQIQAAWNQGMTKGQSPAHKNFPDQMCMKTVINRATKLIINSSDDADLFDDEEQITVDAKAEVVRTEIKENANREAIGFDEESPEAIPAPAYDTAAPTMQAQSGPAPVSVPVDQQAAANGNLNTQNGPSW